jgi:hypothetical protein
MEQMHAEHGVEIEDQVSRDALVLLVLRGMARGRLSSAQQELVDKGFATSRGDLLVPTQSGVALAGRIRRVSAADDEQRLRELFYAFLPINRELRQLCTDWQCRPDGSANDHSDAGYDAALRDRLEDVHGRVDRVLRRLAGVAPELEHYRADLRAAIERLDDGETSALTSPLSASYHNVWMWLHQELLLMLGISRAEDAELEERLVSAMEP